MATRRLTRIGISICAALMLAAVAATLVVSQAQGHQEEEARFQLRADIAARFAATYASQLLGHERTAATAELGALPPSSLAFESLNESFGFPASVLLDSRGDALAVWPANPAVLGTNLGAKYAHLAQAVRGHDAVSNLVLSAARRVPVVAFAVPFDTPNGRRVYSGAYDVTTTPLGAYLDNAIPIPGHRAYLLDSAGNVIVRNPSPTDHLTHPLVALDPALNHAMQAAAQGEFDDGGTASYFAERSVPGTPWRVVVEVPDATLFAALTGAVLWASWAAFVLFALALVGGLVALFRYLDRRADLVRVMRQLDHVARIDSLTGLHNRRHLEEQLDAALSASRRRREPLALLLIDVDHFKRVNDAHGHDAGDRVLREVARRMATCRRREDVLGRWGGEEFLVIMENTGADAARVAAERFHAAVAAHPVDFGQGRVRVTISVGVVAAVDVARGVLLRTVDEALYAAKAQGRDRVVVAGSPSGVETAAHPEALTPAGV